MDKFKKINKEEYYNEDYNVYDNIIDKVSDELLANVYNYEEKLQESLINCESPIEQLLAMELEKLNIKNILFYNPYIDVLGIDKQKEIECEGKKYRVDFSIPVLYKNQGLKEFIVECDGYDFHQKTKEQVEKDNIRQRDLQKKGYIVIKFSGTEIWHKPYKCAQEILNIILSYCEYKNE